MPFHLSTRASAAANDVASDESTEQSALIALSAQPRSASVSRPLVMLRRMDILLVAVLVVVGVMLCGSLLLSSSPISLWRAVFPASSPSSSPSSALSSPTAQQATSNDRSPLTVRSNAPLPQQQQQQQQRQRRATNGTKQQSGAESEKSNNTTSAVMGHGSLTPVSNAAGVRYVAERRHAGYIARENYNIHSNNRLTLASKPPHDGCKALEEPAAGATTTAYQCDIHNLTDALTVCSSLSECVGVVCWKEHWEGCQLKSRPVRHDNNHRFVALYKDEAAVEEAEAAWRQQADEVAARSQKGQLGTFNPAPCGSGSKCVVSMGLYGAAERYTSNAIINARLLPTVLPGWKMRVYHDNSVPDTVLSALRVAGGELVDMSGSSLQGGIAGMYWRFMVSEDESVDRWLIRDADCHLSQREAAAVAAWIASGYSIHIMRDHPNHGRRMMGGMWGGVKHAVRNMTERIVAAASDVNKYNGDQEFLAFHIYPHIEHDQISHDSWTCLSFTNSHPFPKSGKRPFDNSSFVGMIHGKSDEQLNGDIRCCLINREASIACRDDIDDRWG